MIIILCETTALSRTADLAAVRGEGFQRAHFDYLRSSIFGSITDAIGNLENIRNLTTMALTEHWQD